MAAGEVDGLVAPRCPHDLDGLGQSGDAGGRGIEGQAERLVVRGHPAGADARVEAAAGKGGGGGELLGQHRRVPEVVGKDMDGDP